MPQQLADRAEVSRVVERCQVCSEERLESILFLGYLPPVNQMPEIGTALREQPRFPAQLQRCPQCTLVQLGLAVNAEILFPPEYPYTSGTTRSLRENFAQLARESTVLLSLEPQDLVVDVGSNDGTLLSQFHGFRVLGIEPTAAAELAIGRNIPTIRAFFNRELAADVRRDHGPARLVTAANVFAHMDDIHEVMEGILTLMDDSGVFITESHDLLSVIQGLQYDTIYHEHLRYYSLQSLSFLLEKHGLSVFRVQRIPTHGGSIRVYAARAGVFPVDASVAARGEEERQAGLDDARLRAFAQSVTRSKLQLQALLLEIKEQGKSICGIGAPSRASTLVNYVGLDDGILHCVYEIAGSQKIGKYMPGTLIPVLEESDLFTRQPDYALMLSWHIADELMPKLIQKGFRGDFIVPLPTPKIIRSREII